MSKIKDSVIIDMRRLGGRYQGVCGTRGGGEVRGVRRENGMRFAGLGRESCRGDCDMVEY